MSHKVKRYLDRGRKPSLTRLSAKNQLTVPVAELRAAGLGPGDSFRVEARGPGQIVITRVDELIARHAGVIDSGGRFRADVEGLRDEWQ